MYCHLFLFLSLFSTSSPAVVTWLPDTSFSLPNNFDNGDVPCSKKTVVFNDDIENSVRIESKCAVKELILPKSGDIIIFDGEINFGADGSDSNCTEGVSHYLEKSQSFWAEAGVWSSPRFNEATPDAERVPCYDDVVVFPPESEFTVTLPDLKQNIQKLIIRNMSFSSLQFKEYTNDLGAASDEIYKTQRFVLNRVIETGIDVQKRSCNSVSGCPCQNHPLEIDCSTKYCPAPTCVDPIKPIGHCCKICGGYIIIDINESSFQLMAFKELVDITVNAYGNNLAYYVGRLPDKKVQVVIVEKNQYSGVSAEAANEVNYLVDDHWIEGVKLAQISGIPVSKTGISGKIAVGMFFTVVLVMGGIYAYYYKLPEMRYPIMSRGMPRSVFSRFQRRTDSVVSLTRRDSGVPIGSGTATAFRNPLYDSKRGRVQVTESVAEE